MPWLSCKKAWMQASRTVSTSTKTPGRWRHHLGGCRLAFIDETWAKTNIAHTMVAAHAERLVAKTLRGRWRTLIQIQNAVAPSP
jgi:hypothetical protein